MNPKTDKEDISYDGIAFLFEIIANFRFWQEIDRRESTIIRQNYGHIFNFDQVHRISMYLYFLDI